MWQSQLIAGTAERLLSSVQLSTWAGFQRPLQKLFHFEFHTLELSTEYNAVASIGFLEGVDTSDPLGWRPVSSYIQLPHLRVFSGRRARSRRGRLGLPLCRLLVLGFSRTLRSTSLLAVQYFVQVVKDKRGAFRAMRLALSSALPLVFIWSLGLLNSSKLCRACLVCPVPTGLTHLCTCPV